MTVGELIKRLKELDPNLKVVTEDIQVTTTGIEKKEVLNILETSEYVILRDRE